MQVKIALVGNSGCGKTTLFNVLTGVPQNPRNRAGITVDKREGQVKGWEEVTLLDLPGIVSLSPYTLKEAEVRRSLVQEKPDAVLNVIDGTNLERGLFLGTQLAELGIPRVMAVSKMDLVRRSGRKIDCGKLEERLQCRVLELSARKEKGCMEAVLAAVDAAGTWDRSRRPMVFEEDVERALQEIGEILQEKIPEAMRRWYEIKVFERDARTLRVLDLSPKELETIEEIIRAAEAAEEDDSESVLTNQRYAFIASVMEEM